MTNHQKQKELERIIYQACDIKTGEGFLKPELQLQHLFRAMNEICLDTYGISSLGEFIMENSDFEFRVVDIKGEIITYDLTLSLKENCKNKDFANFLYEIFNIN